MGPEGITPPEIAEEAAKFELEKYKGSDRNNVDTISPGAIDDSATGATEESEVDRTVEAEKSEETITPTQAHQSWKENIIKSLSDPLGRRAESVHYISRLTAFAGAITTAMSNESVNNFYNEMMRYTGERSSAESFLIAGGVMLGSAALLEIGNYVATKIGENARIHLHQELKAEEV